MAYADFKTQMLARTTGLDIDKSGDFDCVDMPKAYAEHLFPGVGWVTLVGYGDAKDLWGRINENYFTKIPNDPKDPNQLPQPGDIMVFDKTPIPGYSNTFDNPYGHVGVCDSADKSGYTLLQQSSGTGKKPWLAYAAWNYRRCLGWYRPKQINNPASQPKGVNEMVTDLAMVQQMAQVIGGRLGFGGHPNAFDPGQKDLPAHVGRDAGKEFSNWYFSDEAKNFRDKWLPELVRKAEAYDKLMADKSVLTPQPDPDGQKWRDLKKLKALEKELSA